jgi:hypothetical protein
LGTRKIVLAFADTHGGHLLGLMNPAVTLYKEDERGELVRWHPRPGPVQEYLWENYIQDIDNVRELAGDDPVVVIHGGDACHGNKYPSQLVSTRMADQILIAVANFTPILELPTLTTVRLVQGTAAHGFGEASAEVLITSQLRSQRPDLDIATLRHGLANVDGTSIDYAHHGPSTGIRIWTRGNILRLYAKSLILDEIARHKEPPRVILRSHRHEMMWETVQVRSEDGDGNVTFWTSDIIVLPAECGLSEYGQQATQSKYLITDGLVALEIVDGELYKVHPFVRAQDLRTEETL